MYKLTDHFFWLQNVWNQNEYVYQQMHSYYICFLRVVDSQIPEQGALQCKNQTLHPTLDFWSLEPWSWEEESNKNCLSLEEFSNLIHKGIWAQLKNSRRKGVLKKDGMCLLWPTHNSRKSCQTSQAIQYSLCKCGQARLYQAPWAENSLGTGELPR